MPSDYDLENHLIVAQYISLRNEIGKDIELQSQAVGLAIVALGTVIGVSAQTSNPVIVLTYPILAVFLALAWAAAERGVRLVGAYIADNIERPFLHKLTEGSPHQLRLNWEHFIHQRRKKRRMFYSAAAGIFVVAELVALAVGSLLLYRMEPIKEQNLVANLERGTLITQDNLIYVVLFVLDIVSVLVTLAALSRFPDYRLYHNGSE